MSLIRPTSNLPISGSTDTDNLSLRRVLIVTRATDRRDAITRALATECTEALHAVSDEMALRLVESEELDAVVLDGPLENLRRSQLCRRLKAVAGRPLPVFYLSSGDATVDAWRDAVELGADGCLAAPFAVNDLRVAANEAVATHAAMTPEHVTGMRSVLGGVTERKQAEPAIVAALFEQAPSFLAVMRGPAHTYERVNPAHRRLLGQRDVIGKPVIDAVPELGEQGFTDILDHVYATGEPFIGKQMPVQLTRVGGMPAEIRYIDIAYHRLTQSYGEHLIISHGVDVTDQVLAHKSLRQSEERLREQFANLPVPTSLWEYRGKEFVLSEWNKAALHLLSRDLENATGKTVREILPDIDDLADDMRSCLSNNIVVQRSVEIDAGPELGRRCFDLTIGPQQPDRVLMHAFDTTARSLLEIQLRQAQKMEAVGQLAGGVAHDFNNLLTVIRAHSVFLMESLPADDPQREDAEAIHKAGIRAAGLTRQLLAFSRKQILKPQVIDLNACLEQTRTMLDRLLGDDIEIIVDLGIDLQRVVADPGQIDQVIVNLAVNARDAMQLGGRLTISTGMVIIGTNLQDTRGILLPGNYVKLSVCDTGHGMDAAVQSRLFEPFFTTKELGKGTGLGLATVYGIVKQSGGYITVDSAPRAGTTFNVYLPAVPSEEEGEQLQEAERAAERGVETILLVEDEPVVREVARRILRRHGYVVLEAASGQEALSVSAAFPSVIHLVISDAVMPGMPSAEAVRRLQEKRPGLKALFMSGYNDAEVVRRGIASAAVPFIQKPFASRDLASAVRTALDSSRSADGQPNAR
jgi:signal transduction histidine kinase/DNA-binding response OmpR family regulator